ncbi:MAG: hypothetical protein E4G98_01680 [Promethearchaeota archaeon]|nr:MAG: hypothetical protein E4G98_01680 [Candidatus Lokiarchaeota archaeon]
MKNVDNFIFEDRHPIHIQTRIIYSEKELLEVLEDYHDQILGMLDEDQPTIEKVQTFHKTFRTDLLEKKNRASLGDPEDHPKRS